MAFIAPGRTTIRQRPPMPKVMAVNCSEGMSPLAAVSVAKSDQSSTAKKPIRVAAERERARDIPQLYGQSLWRGRAKAPLPVYHQYLAVASLAGNVSSTLSSTSSHLRGGCSWASLPASRTCTGASLGPGFLPSCMAAASSVLLGVFVIFITSDKQNGAPPSRLHRYASCKDFPETR